MDFLHFDGVSFQPDTNIGQLCKELNKVIGNAVWYDTFNIRNTKWLWLVNNIVAVMKNNNNILCGFFGGYFRVM